MTGTLVGEAKAPATRHALVAAPVGATVGGVHSTSVSACRGTSCTDSACP